MFEIIDTATTNVLTAMVYGVPIWVMLSFVHFVATHIVSRQHEFEPSIRAAEFEQLSEQHTEAAEALPMVSEPEATMPTVATVECVPVDWTLWKVAELRDKAMRGAFAIESRQGGRLLKKKALIEQYARAMAC